MRTLIAFVAAILFFATARTARADFWAVVPGEAPSKEHPKGTAIVFNEAAVERDLATGKTLRTSGPLFTPTEKEVSVVVASGETFLATSAGVKGDRSDEIALWVIGSDLRPRERFAIGSGSSPTIVAGGSWLAIGFYEWRHWTKAYKDWAPQDVYRVVVLDRASRKVLTQKVYGGPVDLLAPQLNIEDRMLVIHEGRLFVSLPYVHRAHLVAASLPALTTLAETDLTHDRLMGAMRIAWYVDRLVAIGPKWIELSSDLAVVAEKPWSDQQSPSGVAIDGTRVLVDGAIPSGVTSVRRASIVYPKHIAWAWGHAIAIGKRHETEDAPVEVVVD